MNNKRREILVYAHWDGMDHPIMMGELSGVFDGHRMGALRFKQYPDGPFLNDNIKHASPPWASLRELEQISLRLEADNAVDHPEYLQWLNQLVNPGSSLGGSRPKAGVLDSHNQLWIAKFPSRGDVKDIGAWEQKWRKVAENIGISRSEQELMARAFHYSE